MHVDQVLMELKVRGFDGAKKQVISSALARYTDRGQRFRRVGPNKYAVLD